MTTDLPADVQYPVAGTNLVLTCTESVGDLTKFAFQKDGVEVRALSNDNMYTITSPTAADHDGSYTCIAANDAEDQKTAASTAKAVAFISETFVIDHL